MTKIQVLDRSLVLENDRKRLLEIMVSNSALTTDGCWEWSKQISNSGYGVAWYKAAWRAHRLMFAVCFMDFDLNGYHICHTCDNRRCVNPSHLFKGTAQDNIDDKVNKNRQSKGEARPNAVLNPTIVRIMRRLRERGFRYTDLAEIFNCSKTAVAGAVTGQWWRHV